MKAISRHAPLTSDLIDLVYNSVDPGDQVLADYFERHGVVSMLILTQTSKKAAAEMARMLSTDIDGKTVIEIGAGVGYLAIEMAKRAKRVFAIEVDPGWSWVFTRSLYEHKPRNLTWIFGDAAEMVGTLKGDVVVIVSRSGQKAMKDIANKLAPKVITPLLDTWGDLAVNETASAGGRGGV